jgi:spermidine/putrescine transport system ATP-binding protein
MVGALSGGQKQRVAIARALAVEPSVLLLDEPLSALDLKLRQHMRNELRAIQRRVGITFIYITHDQGEALTMSDRIAVMNDGVIQQVGDGKAVYDNPQTAFVASFVGENNMFAGRVTETNGSTAAIETPVGRLVGSNRQGLRQGEEALAFIRPEAFSLAAHDNANSLQAEVGSIAFEGNVSHIFLKGGGRRDIVVTVGRAAELPQPGSQMRIFAPPPNVLILPKGKFASD